jgi:hypothetical protein
MRIRIHNTEEDHTGTDLFLSFHHLGERGLRQHKMRSSCGKEEEEGEVVEGVGVVGPAPTPLDESCYIID